MDQIERIRCTSWVDRSGAGRDTWGTLKLPPSSAARKRSVMKKSREYQGTHRLRAFGEALLARLDSPFSPL